VGNLERRKFEAGCPSGSCSAHSKLGSISLDPSHNPTLRPPHKLRPTIFFLFVIAPHFFLIVSSSTRWSSSSTRLPLTAPPPLTPLTARPPPAAATVPPPSHRTTSPLPTTGLTAAPPTPSTAKSNKSSPNPNLYIGCPCHHPRPPPPPFSSAAVSSPPPPLSNPKRDRPWPSPI
jgi:hypothetical protein